MSFVVSTITRSEFSLAKIPCRNMSWSMLYQENMNNVIDSLMQL